MPNPKSSRRGLIPFLFSSLSLFITVLEGVLRDERVGICPGSDTYLHNGSDVEGKLSKTREISIGCTVVTC